MLRDGAQSGEMLALRLWATPVQLRAEGSEQAVPLWIGSVQTLQHQRAFEVVGMWRPLREAGSSLEALTGAVEGLEHRVALHPQSQVPVLRIRTDRPAAPRN
jgi:hypothetical protein